jgi:hypothetical protein
MLAGLRSPFAGLAAAAGVVALIAGIVGYVYSHEPARDVLEVQFATADVDRPALTPGVVLAVDGEVLRVIAADGTERSTPLPAHVVLEDLVRLGEPPIEGARVNVGVDETVYGQVITGIVSLEQTP